MPEEPDPIKYWPDHLGFPGFQINLSVVPYTAPDREYTTQIQEADGTMRVVPRNPYPEEAFRDAELDAQREGRICIMAHTYNRTEGVSIHSACKVPQVRPKDWPTPIEVIKIHSGWFHPEDEKAKAHALQLIFYRLSQGLASYAIKNL